MDAKVKKMIELERKIDKIYNSFDKKTKDMKAEEYFDFAYKNIDPLTKKYRDQLKEINNSIDYSKKKKEYEPWLKWFKEHWKEMDDEFFNDVYPDYFGRYHDSTLSTLEFNMSHMLEKKWYGDLIESEMIVDALKKGYKKYDKKTIKEDYFPY